MKRYSLTRENLNNLKKFVRQRNRDLFLSGNNNEKFFFKIKPKEKVN
ncbi:MAG: hypothetical protein M1419_00445 [Bacteroidetes bacterium]|nr:hypothetical protein [Bacteroidota bacterium]